MNGTEPFQKGRKIPFHICVIMSRKNQKIESFIVEKFISGGISGCKKFFIHAEYCWKNRKKSKKGLDKSPKRIYIIHVLNRTVFNSAGSGRLAQSVEQGTENPRVPSSILGPATIFFARIPGKKTWSLKRLRFMHRRCASWHAVPLHTPPGVLHNTAFSDEAAPLCSAMKHLLFANMKHKRLKSLV